MGSGYPHFELFKNAKGDNRSIASHGRGGYTADEESLLMAEKAEAGDRLMQEMQTRTLRGMQCRQCAGSRHEGCSGVGHYTRCRRLPSRFVDDLRGKPFFGTIRIRTVGGREILKVREDQVVLHSDESSFEGKAECTWWSLLRSAGIPTKLRRKVQLRRTILGAIHSIDAEVSKTETRIIQSQQRVPSENEKEEDSGRTLQSGRCPGPGVGKYAPSSTR
jgi:hypothetical protein